MMKKPPCADWSVWTGIECEGDDTTKGRTTLFIRALPGVTAETDITPLRFGERAQAVWFCKEFRNWQVLENIANCFPKGAVTLEVSPTTLGLVPHRFLKAYRLFYKLPVQLKSGDFVCVGHAFHDESFRIGTGDRAKPDMYLNDQRIL